MLSIKNWDNKTWISSTKYIQSFNNFLVKQKKLTKHSKILDIGCGTGHHVASLGSKGLDVLGIDISENMIQEAEKLDIYDTLIVGDIVEKLNASHDKFDLLVALDVLIYIGDVKSTFQAARKCCKLDSLFVFSVEIQDENGYSLLKSSRYAHSDEYIMKQSNGLFDLVNSQNVKLRKEGENWIDGKVYIFRSGKL